MIYAVAVLAVLSFALLGALAFAVKENFVAEGRIGRLRRELRDANERVDNLYDGQQALAAELHARVLAPASSHVAAEPEPHANVYVPRCGLIPLPARHAVRWVAGGDA